MTHVITVLPKSDGLSYNNYSGRPGKHHFELLNWGWGAQETPKTVLVIGITLCCLPEFEDKTLVVKTIYTFDT